MTTRNVKTHRKAIHQNTDTHWSTPTTVASFILLIGHLNLIIQWFNSNHEPLCPLTIQFEQHKGTPSRLQSKVQLKEQTCPDILDFVLLSTESYSSLPEKARGVDQSKAAKYSRPMRTTLRSSVILKSFGKITN